MAAFRTAQSFDVSEPLFRLMTEAIRLHSNEVAALSSLVQLVEARRRTVLLSLRRHDPRTLREHFAAMPSSGPIGVECELSRAGADCLAAAQTWLSAELAQEASLADALSALLFDYAVERAAARMLERLGAGRRPVASKTMRGGDESANVVPLK